MVRRLENATCRLAGVGCGAAMRHIAHLSDLHFGADPKAQPRLYQGLLGAFKGQQVDLIIFTGDVFDTNDPDAGLIDGFLKLHTDLEITLGGPKPTIILPGNHDRRAEGVFAPYRDHLFKTLKARLAHRADVHVMGLTAPFLAQRIELPDFPCDIVSYDSTFLPAGMASAGGVLRQEDLISMGRELTWGNTEKPLLFLLHHHLIPTPVTDLSAIDTEGRPLLQRLLVGRLLPWLVSSGDREELTMTALGAGSALTTLQTLGRAVVVLHGHKHNATVRLLKGLDGDGDLLITSAGSSGLTQGWSSGEYDEAPKLWPSVNFIKIDEQHVTVSAQAWSPTQADRLSALRHLVSAKREGKQWLLEAAPLNEAEFEAVLALNEMQVQLVESHAQVGRVDLLTQRKLVAHPRAWLNEYWEVLEGAPGSFAREIVVDGAPRKDAKCPARLHLPKDCTSTWRLEGGLFSNLGDAQEGHQRQAYSSADLLNRSRASIARLKIDMGPIKSIPFAAVTNLMTGKEQPYPLSRENNSYVLTYKNCPARTLLRVYWPLER